MQPARCPLNMLHYGVENGDSWVPGEVNTSIRPEWFYHPGEDDKSKNSASVNGYLLQFYWP